MGAGEATGDRHDAAVDAALDAAPDVASDVASHVASGPPRPARRAASDVVRYRERLWVPWTWWALGIVGGGLLCLEVTTTLTVGQLWVGWQVITVSVVAGVLVGWLVSQSTATVAVTDRELVAGPARLPVEHVGELRLVDVAARRRLMGPAADPAAYLFVRAWVRTAVLVEVTDPADPTPYWLVSTRRPQALAAALGR